MPMPNYNPNYNSNYNPNYPYYYQPTPQVQVQPQPQPQPQPQAQTQAIQDGGFVSVPNEEVVYTYPVGLGKCVTFKVEGKPVILEKIMGFSQFEAPKIKRYRLVEEEVEIEEKGEVSEISEIRLDIDKIWDAINEIKDKDRDKEKKPTSTTAKKNSNSTSGNGNGD